MIGLGVKKGNKKKKQHRHGSVTTIKSLPKDLLVEIFAKVATTSISDLCKVKQCCKEFLHAAEEDYVYRQASMENFALVPLTWFTKEKESVFLGRCKKSGNSEITYREGMVEYFTHSNVKLGLKNLRKAALEGHHHEAKYAYCMILMNGEDRKEGLELFCSLKASTCVRRCRGRVKSFVRNMWVNNKPVLSNCRLSLCASSTCDGKRLKKISRTWSSSEDENAESIEISCECCSVDYELALFGSMFGV
ncbi:hypothetical protein VNO78_22698 [Psophocarpus tetragonolobus]|uniref:F-box domain-containing protein n=1 Tax=Psophocarpus tetragonolobus TaxID=3891 RepID=A0AAN9XCF1_PSOTE